MDKRTELCGHVRVLASSWFTDSFLGPFLVAALYKSDPCRELPDTGRQTTVEDSRTQASPMTPWPAEAGDSHETVPRSGLWLSGTVGYAYDQRFCRIIRIK